MITEDSILDAWLFLRKNNCSIPDETLDFMKKISLRELKKMDGPEHMHLVRFVGYIDPIKEKLDLLTDEARYALFSSYCRGCGSTDKGCQCWNDE